MISKRKRAKRAQSPVPHLAHLPIKLHTIPHAGGIKIRFEGSDQVRLLKEAIAASVADTGRIIFIRFKLLRAVKPSVVSKDSKPVFLMWHGGAALAHIDKRGERWVKAIKLYKPTELWGCAMPYRVDVGVGKD